MVTIRTFDESVSGTQTPGPAVELRVGPITVREIIEARVRAEIRRLEAAPSVRFEGLVRSTEFEELVNGKRTTKVRKIDADREVAKAIEGFERQAFLLLLPEGQAESLEQVVKIDETFQASFVRLIPLVGG